MPGLAVELFVTHAPAFASRRPGSSKRSDICLFTDGSFGVQGITINCNTRQPEKGSLQAVTTHGTRAKGRQERPGGGACGHRKKMTCAPLGIRRRC